LPAHLGLHPALAALAGAILSGGIAWLVGRPILRLKGHYLAIARKAKSLYFHVLCGALSLCFAIGSHWDPRLWKIAEIILLFWFFLSVSSLPFLHRRLPGSGGVYMLHAPLVIYGISSILAIAHVRDATNAALTLGLTYSICLVATLAFIRIFPKYAYLLLE